MARAASAQLGKAYPPAGATAAVVELDRYDERQLLAPEGGAFPLIVRMETVTEKGLADGHTLQARARAVPPSDCGGGRVGCTGACRAGKRCWRASPATDLQVWSPASARGGLGQLVLVHRPRGRCQGRPAGAACEDRPAGAAQELEVGAGQKSWVQSQTTFVALARDEHAGLGGLRARALKQKIWVEGVSYELQEIYGIDSLNSRRRVRPAARPRASCSAAISRQQAGGRRARKEGRLGDCMRFGNPVSLRPKPCNAVVCRAALLQHQQSSCRQARAAARLRRGRTG